MSVIASHLRDRFVREHAPDAVELIEKHPDAMETLVDASTEALVELAERLDPQALHNLFATLPAERKAELLSQVSIRTSLIIMKGLDTEQRETFLAALPEKTREDIIKIQSFPEDMAGHYTESVYAFYTEADTVESALDKLKRSKAHRTRSLYLVDNAGALIGRVDLQDIALAQPDTLLSALLHPVSGFAALTTPRSELIDIFSRYRVDSIPVLDPDGRLVGVVRYGSLFQAAEEDLTGDLQKMVGVSPEERALSTPWFSVKKRLPWLHINLFTAFIAAAVVGLFETTIAQFTALAILLPVVAGQSGNAGAQALAVTMRGLALREINLAKWRQVLVKEIKVGVIDGFVLAITCGLGVFAWSQSLGLALVIGIAMIISMVAAGVSGALVPIILVRFGQDPATASSIILTTVTDITGFVAFLGTGTLLASML